MDVGTPGSTAVRIAAISAAQNKRGKNCYEGGMKTGSFTWYKDMGGNSNWMYLSVVPPPRPVFGATTARRAPRRPSPVAARDAPDAHDGPDAPRRPIHSQCVLAPSSGHQW